MTPVYRNLLTEVIAPKYELPAGYNAWGIKSVRPDLRTRNNFQWPFPGQETERYELEDHDDPRPARPGDGLCVALDWEGMASAGYPARTLLLVAYRTDEARGCGSKLRVPQCFVVDLIDGEQLLVTHGHQADLSAADLCGANLCGANLRAANLRWANLGGANLCAANLRAANLRWANLGGADLRAANLRAADLDGANLDGANLDGVLK